MNIKRVFDIKEFISLFTKEGYLILLLIYFAFNGFVENYPLIPFWAIVKLFLVLFFWTFFLVVFCYFIFRDIKKAARFTFIIVWSYLFFGGVHDGLKALVPGSFLSSYGFILGLLFFVLAWSFFTLRKRMNVMVPSHWFSYIYSLLLFVCVFQLSRILIKGGGNESFYKLGPGIQRCDTCNKPDIYIIVADEYAGRQTLRERFGFDNSEFIEFLRQQNFSVADSSASNYNSTPISIASTFNLQYLDLAANNVDGINMKEIYNVIDTNILIRFLRVSGYKFYNESVFTVGGFSPAVKERFLPMEHEILLSQTLLNRLKRDLWFHLYKYKILDRPLSDDHRLLRNNELIFSKVKEIVETEDRRSKVVYAHLNLPHYPYFFDSTGKLNNDSLTHPGAEYNQSAYLGYLVYANKRYKELLSFILTKSKKPPVIIFFSDHGFRYFPDGEDKKNVFNNLFAIHYAKGESEPFKEGITNVNLVREFLNKAFKQNLVILPDTSYLLERNVELKNPMHN